MSVSGEKGATITGKKFLALRPSLWLVPAEPTRVFLIDKSLVGQPTYGAGLGPVVAEGTPHRHQVGMISMQLVPETPKRALAPKRAAQALARHPMTDPLGEVDHVLIPDGRRQWVNEDQVVQLIDVDRVVAIDATVTGPEHDLPTLWVDQPPMVVVSLVGQRRGDFFDIDGIQVEHVVSVGRTGSFAQGVRCGKGGCSDRGGSGDLGAGVSAGSVSRIWAIRPPTRNI